MLKQRLGCQPGALPDYIILSLAYIVTEGGETVQFKVYALHYVNLHLSF